MPPVKPQYILPMFPYPSGILHVGHLRVYSISHVFDLFATIQTGLKAIHPIAWDSFGLPAERAALSNNTNPLEWTESNILKMKNQLKECGIQFDWSREFSTHHPSYYKHTQRLFLLLYEVGLVVKQKSIVNWDPIDQTVLANEQVVNGRAERSGAVVESRFLEQWSVKTSWFAKDLDRDLEVYCGKWPRHVVKTQKDWIGAVKGGFVDVRIVVVGRGSGSSSKDDVELFLEEGVKELRSDGLVVVSATNQLVINSMDPIIKSKWEEALKRLPSQTYTYGFPTGLHAHYKSLKIPIIISPFLVQQNYTYMSTHSTHPQWKSFHSANTVRDHVETAAVEGVRSGTVYMLKDWVVSRQRKWGTPIPIIHCTKCGPSTPSITSLPITHTHPRPTCPKCGETGQYDSDTLDTFFDSSWYFLHFLNPPRSVDLYIGGREHATLHLLYARFMWKVLHEKGMVEGREPFKEFVDVGVVKSLAYWDNGWVEPKEAVKRGVEGKMMKMSKSRLNGVDPVQVVRSYGADCVRFHVLSRNRVRDDFEWREDDMKGAVKFVEKVKGIVERVGLYCDFDLDSVDVQVDDVLCKGHDLILSKIETDLKRRSLHTITSHLYKLANLIEKELGQGRDVDGSVVRKCTLSLVALSYPFLTETCLELTKGKVLPFPKPFFKR